MKVTRPEDYIQAPNPSYSDALTKREYMATAVLAGLAGSLDPALAVQAAVALADELMETLNTYPYGSATMPEPTKRSK